MTTMKCDRCRRKSGALSALTVELTGGPSFHVSVCDSCKRSFQETMPKALSEWKRGALYIKEERLFLADGGTYGGILRNSHDPKRCLSCGLPIRLLEYPGGPVIQGPSVHPEVERWCDGQCSNSDWRKAK